jgi:membrane protein YqaA with SNARE-associated domain
MPASTDTCGIIEVIQDHLLKAVIALVAFVAAVTLLGLLFEDQLAEGATWVVDRIGFPGMALILLVTDTLVTPFPPDLLLVMIAKSRLAEDWPRYVLMLGLISVTAGMLGWSIGRWLGHRRPVQRWFGEFKEDRHDFIRRYGFWAVVIGAITPLPYSVTCWSAGVLGIRWGTVLLASLLSRLPRFFLYYWLLSSSKHLFA